MRVLLVVLGCGLFGACGDTGASLPDAAADAHDISDVRRDAPRDGNADLGTSDIPAAVDGGDTGGGDTGGGDTGAAAYVITFGEGPAGFSAALTAARIGIDGSGHQVLSLPSFTPRLFVDVNLSPDPSPGDSGPRARDPWKRRLSLPGALGELYCLDDPRGLTHLVVARPSGALETLYSQSGTPGDLLCKLGATPTGTRVVAGRPGKGIVLLRTDGTTYSNGKPALALDFAPAPLGAITNVSVAGDRVYLVTTPTNGPATLWSGPLDGSQVPQPVVMPKIAGAPPNSLTFLTWNTGSSRVALLGSRSLGNVIGSHLFVVDGAGAVVTTTTASSGLPALSPGGGHVAYNKTIVKTDGTGASVVSATPIARRRFVNGNTLVFTRPSTTNLDTDLVRYDMKTATTAATKVADGFVTNGHRLEAYWPAPSGAFLNLWIRQTDPGVIGYRANLNAIRAINVSTWTLNTIASAVDFVHHAESRCAAKSSYFAYGAHLKMIADPGSGAQAVDLTPNAQDFVTIEQIRPSRDCRLVAFVGRHLKSQLVDRPYDLYVVNTSGTPVLRNITKKGLLAMTHYVGDIAFTPDNAHIVFSAGPGRDNMALLAAPLATSGPPVVVRAGSGATRQWMIFGVH